MEDRIRELEKKIEHLEFKQDLLFYDTPSNRILYENDITKDEYDKIMDLMDKYRKFIDDGEKTSHPQFENEMYSIVPRLHGNYHFVEYITRAFKEEHRWEEVFDSLYSELPKYKGMK